MLNTKILDNENKIPDAVDLVTKPNFITKSIQIENEITDFSNF